MVMSGNKGIKNIFLIIFIILFGFVLLHSIYVKLTCNKRIEGLEVNDDDDDVDINKRFKRIEDRVNKIQEQITGAEKANEENAQTLKKIKSA